MRRVEIFMSVSPKLILDHYWNVLSLITWKGLIEPRSEKSFTVSDITEEVLRGAQLHKNDENLLCSRIYLRSMTIIQDLINELIGSGLLIKDGENLRKTDDFSHFYYLLNHKIRRSLRRYVAWAILYLYAQKKTMYFSTDEIVALSSYHDEEYVAELPHLVKRKGGCWSKLLKGSDGEWELLEEPAMPSRPILLADVYDRLSYALLELSKTKEKFRIEEVIGKVRELERRSVEEALRRFKLRSKDGKWQINDEILRGLKMLLEVEVKGWPSFGISVFKNPYFKLQSRRIYVDVPNMTIQDFLTELDRICHEHKGLQEIYENAKELAKTFNQELEKSLGMKWLSFVIRKQPFGVRIKINWNRFRSFLDDFAKSELPLREKYSYIFNCRAPSLILVLRGGKLERVQQGVKEICEEELEQIRQVLESLIGKINEAKDRLLRITSYRRTIPIEPSTLDYLPEMTSTLRALISLVENGAIPACYREMRKILENLSWMIFDDLLLYKSNALRSRRQLVEFLVPYRSVSREWYEWASQEKLVLRKLKDLEDKIEVLANTICLYAKDEEKSVNEKLIKKVLFKRMSYPMFLLLTGINVKVPRKLKGLVPQYEVEMLSSLAIEDIKSILKDVKSEYSSIFVDTLLEEIISKIFKKDSKIVPQYPSPEFVLAFVSKTLSVELLEFYKEYSQFVHSYFTSWHIFPFSSVLEFKVFKNELLAFTRTLVQLLNSYLQELFSQSILKS